MRGWRFTLIASAIFFVLFLYVFLSEGEQSRQSGVAPAGSPPIMEPRRQVRDVTPKEVLQPPKLDTEVLERLPAVEPPPPPQKPPEPVRWKQPVIKASGILEFNGTVMELSGIRPLELDQTCQSEDGRQWPCGRFARTAFRNFVRSRTLSCRPASEIPATGTLRSRCDLGGKDLSGWLVRNGWALPSLKIFSEALQEAKRDKRGMWRQTAP